jgi:hypothetical protein
MRNTFVVIAAMGNIICLFGLVPTLRTFVITFGEQVIVHRLLNREIWYRIIAQWSFVGLVILSIVGLIIINARKIIKLNNKCETIISALFLILLVVLIARFIYINMFELSDYLNSDIVNEITYMQKAWEEKSILPDDYIHPNELFIHRLILFYIPVYAITNNFMLSYQITTIAGMFLQLLSLVYLLVKLCFRKPAILLTLCCYLGLNSLCYYIFLAGSTYAGFSTLIFIILGLKFGIMRKMDAGQKIDKTIIFQGLAMLVLSIYTGYGSTRLLLILFVPLFCIDVLFYFKNNWQRERIKIDNRFLFVIYSGFLIMANLASYVTSLSFHRALFNPIDFTITPLTVQLSVQTVSSVLESFLQVFPGPFVPGRLFSVFGLHFVISAILLFLLVVSIIYIVRCSISYFDKFIVLYFAISTLTVFSFLIVSSINVAVPRYFLSSMIISSVIFGIAMNNLLAKKSWLNILFSVFFVFSITVIHVGPARYFYRQNNDSLKAVTEYMVENKYYNVTAQFWNAGIIKGLSNGKITPRHFASASNMAPYLWLTDRSLYITREIDVPNIYYLSQTQKKGDAFKFYLADTRKPNLEI